MECSKCGIKCNCDKYFEDVRVGDVVWCMSIGECEVTSTGDSYFKIKDIDGDEHNIDYNGIYETHYCQSVFWSKPEFELPPKLRRKVKKWRWVYKNTREPDAYMRKYLSNKWYSDQDDLLKRFPERPYHKLCHKLQNTEREMYENDHE